MHTSGRTLSIFSSSRQESETFISALLQHRTSVILSSSQEIWKFSPALEQELNSGT